MSDTADCLVAWCDGDEWCAITCAAEILSKKWHPVVYQLLERGPMGFNQLESRIGEISSPVLSDGLADLEDYEVLERSVVSEQPLRVEYSLTERGRDLEPVIDAMDDWGTRHAARPSWDGPGPETS